MSTEASAHASAEPTARPGGVRRVLGAPGRLLARGFRRLWQTKNEERARAEVPSLSDRQLADLRRAFAVRELANAAMTSMTRSEASPAALPALVQMAREAAFWSLRAGLPDPAPATATDALARLPPAQLADLLPDEGARDRVRAALGGPETDAGWADRPRDEQERALRELGQLSTAALGRLTSGQRRLRRILLERVALAVAVIVLSIAAARIISTVQLTPSLTAGQPWRASSALDLCKPKEHYCADAVTDIFFCTVDEPNPWVEFDLGERRAFSRLVVRNRTDCCPDRAVPLALEVSDDRLTWRELARRDETFSTWRADFPMAHARYARLRALRRTILHLDEFDLYR